jgi:hypothetical protein
MRYKATTREAGMTRKVLKEQLVSYNEDKAVQDCIVESWLCVDCGTNTHPGSPSGPEMRVAFAMGADDVTIRCNNKTEVYAVKDTVWKRAGMRAWNGCLCIRCLEKRIGRQLRPGDFSQHDRETFAKLPCTERLLNRRGFATVTVQTAAGRPKEVICDIRDAARLNGAVEVGECE